MYKVILADDEVHILVLLRKLVDWNSLGIEIVGEYTDGAETFRAICEKRPDIVITDIMMSGMTGLEIVRECIAQKIDAVFLLISGHAEFEYAHMAIQYGVENYLLKPINKQELENNLQRICARLNSEKMVDETVVSLENRIQFNKEILNGQFLNNLLFKPGWLTPESCQSLLEEYELEGVNRRCRILVLKPSCKNCYTEDQYRLLLKQITHYSVKDLTRAFPQALGTYTDSQVYLLVTLGETEAEDGIHLFFDNLRTRFFEYCDFTMGLSRIAPDLMRLSREEAERAARYRFNEGINRIYEFGTRPQFSVPVARERYLTEYRKFLEVVNPSGVQALFLELDKEAANPCLDPESLIALMEDIARELARSVSKLYHGEVDTSYVDEELRTILNNADRKRALIEAFRDYTNRELKKFGESKYAQEARYIRTAKDYIDAHLSKTYR